MKSKKSNIISLGVIGLIGIGLGSLFRFVEKEGILGQEYNKTANSAIKKIERKYDKDNNGVFDLNEGVQLARAVGYKRPLQSKNISFELQPGDYSDESIYLNMISSNGWKEDYKFPLSTLEELAKR